MVSRSYFILGMWNSTQFTTEVEVDLFNFCLTIYFFKHLGWSGPSSPQLFSAKNDSTLAPPLPLKSLWPKSLIKPLNAMVDKNHWQTIDRSQMSPISITLIYQWKSSFDEIYYLHFKNIIEDIEIVNTNYKYPLEIYHIYHLRPGKDIITIWTKNVQISELIIIT